MKGLVRRSIFALFAASAVFHAAPSAAAIVTLVNGSDMSLVADRRVCDASGAFFDDEAWWQFKPRNDVLYVHRWRQDSGGHV